ncbi:MAG: glutathione S-transferase family protein [Rhodospirillaceae bacterium]|nr:glutathione S-transferase family protein [Rhodospirillaceae bacterium]
MPIIEAQDPSLKDLKGLHLWHGELSSCSQRVRITLAEKGLEWESYIISIPDNEHATPEFQAINPKGLVPAFVDNGTLLIESCDIIDYLDQKYPKPPLRPADTASEATMIEMLAAADKAQADLKLLSHEFLFRPRKQMSETEVNEFAASHNNQVLVDFVKEWQGSDIFPKEKLDAAVNRTDEDFNMLDNAVVDQDWLLGADMTLADIAWMPNIHRMMLMDWPLERYTNLCRWFDRVKARPSYQQALVDWEPPGMAEKFATYVIDRRNSAGVHVTEFGTLAAA